ncbi:DUF2703 domain-containing protein [Candidatus Roizmanbacteria bacterium]|nr:DUF2703 domain-containing protein [Candidatus Roizmanbacteria bacterium]
MKVQLLHTSGCHVWREALIILEEALKAAQEEVRLEIVLIENNVQAKKYRFLGSPTILIDSQDVDPLAKKATNFAAVACRPYFYQGKSYDYPTKEMIVKVLTGIRK